MANRSAIEWTDATWNPWMGCTKISPGCKNCYMFRDQKRYGHDPSVVRRSKTTFRDPLNWTEPCRIFVCSWSDFAHPDVPIVWIDEAWDVMRRAKQHTYLLLTKRPNELKMLLPDDWDDGWPNVWIGVSVENSEYEWRLVALEEIPAMVKFVSAEPLLGPLPNLYSYFPTLDWVIVGGESGPDFRILQAAWVKDIRDDCATAGIPFFFKQWGGAHKKNGAWGGRMLEGRTWNGMPTAHLEELSP